VTTTEVFLWTLRFQVESLQTGEGEPMRDSSLDKQRYWPKSRQGPCFCIDRTMRR
jgi:hypothetical protein